MVQADIIDKVVVSLVNKKPGIHGVELVVELLRHCIDNSIHYGDSHDTTDRIYKLVGLGYIVEVEYTLPDSERVKSLFFPKGTKINT